MFLENLTNELDDLISSTRTLYYEHLWKKLNNPLLQAKTYLSILKTFFKGEKIPLILPLLIDDKFVTEIFCWDKSLLKPEALLFQSSTRSSYFPGILERSNIIPPAHEKHDKQLIRNYRPIYILPILGKISLKILFNRIYNFLLYEGPFNPN